MLEAEADECVDETSETLDIRVDSVEDFFNVRQQFCPFVAKASGMLGEVTILLVMPSDKLILCLFVRILHP